MMTYRHITVMMPHPAMTAMRVRKSRCIPIPCRTPIKMKCKSAPIFMSAPLPCL